MDETNDTPIDGKIVDTSPEAAKAWLRGYLPRIVDGMGRTIANLPKRSEVDSEGRTIANTIPKRSGGGALRDDIMKWSAKVRENDDVEKSADDRSTGRDK